MEKSKQEIKEHLHSVTDEIRDILEPKKLGDDNIGIAIIITHPDSGQSVITTNSNGGFLKDCGIQMMERAFTMKDD